MSKICEQCRSSFEPSRVSARWCSQRCRHEAWRDKQPEKVPTQRTRECDHCGKEFDYVVRGGHERRFCSPPCNYAFQNAARPTSQEEWRKCVVCKKRFQPKQKRGTGSIYCSTTCRDRIKYLKRKGKAAKRLEVDFEALYKRQDGKCAICGEPEKSTDGRSNVKKKLAIDHCHTSGKIRGLLCGRCNQGLGYFKDDPKRMEAAIHYLEGGPV